ncbi:MAG: DUF3160 domain-containing protein, partial [Atribacterota bacterium]
NYQLINGEKRVNTRNIINYWQFQTFSPGALDMLSRQGFIVMPAQNDQFFWIYEENRYKGVAGFVTSDSILQLSHIFYDYILRNLETVKLLPVLRDLTSEMVDLSHGLYVSSPHEMVREAAGRNLVYFSIPANILSSSKTVDPKIMEIVKAEIEKVNIHNGRENSLVFNPKNDPGVEHELDYSQFVPRGHYDRSENLKLYFLAMMWYGQNYFLANQDLDLLQALILTKQLYDKGTKGEKAIDLWLSIYEPTSYLVGYSNDLGPSDYKSILDAVYGEKVSFEELVDSSKMVQARKMAEDLYQKKSKIHPVQVGIPEGARFGFMGQRYIPDSEILQRLSHWPERPFPKGLDVMAVLGSVEAKSILLDQYKEGDKWKDYPGELETLIAQFSGYSPDDWKKNLYTNWLWSLQSLFASPDDLQLPFFMTTRWWQLKNLNTALGSWTELRHDTILYGQPSAAECGDGEEWVPDPPKWYVEPNGAFYQRFLDMLVFSRDGLKSRGLLTEGMTEKYDRLIELVSFLKMMVQKELKKSPITNQEYQQLSIYGALLENLTFSVLYADEGTEGWYNIMSDADKSIALVADVHTSKGEVLEEGVGPAFEILVAVEFDGYLKLARGGVFSYYEFIHPVSDRLTDQKWQEMLQGKPVPSLPDWTKEFRTKEKASEIPRIKYVYSTGC